MRILVTGANGQVGSALLQSFKSLGIVIPVNRAIIDFLKPDKIAAVLERLNPTIVVNAAAYTAVDKAEDERDAAFVINGDSPGAIARWASQRQVPLIHYSTDYVFDGSGSKAWREDDAANPLSAYGASKLAGERAIAASGCAHLIIRTSWVYSAEGTNFLRTIYRLAHDRDELRIVSDQIGAPTSAWWIAEGTARIVAAYAGNLPAAFDRANHCVNLVAGGEASWHRFAVSIVDGLRRRGVALRARTIAPIATKDYPTKARRPLNSRLDLSRLRNVFNLNPPTWPELLERELDCLASSQSR